MRNKLKNYNKQSVINDYLNKFSLNEIKSKHNISITMIYKLLDTYDIKRRGGGREYFFNQNYFDIIDSPDKAYFLGWLYSDGNNFPSTGAIQLKIQEEDINILRIFCNYINQPLKAIKIQVRKDAKNQACLGLCSMYMSKSLVEKGVMKNKTFLLRFPTEEQVPKELIHHFIRGYFDGDGCIQSYTGKKSKSPDYHFIISGGKHILEGIQKEMVEQLNLKQNKLIKNKSIFSLHYGGNCQVMTVKEWLYKDCGDLFLQRKRDKFEQVRIFIPNAKSCLFCGKIAIAKELCQNHYMTFKYYQNLKEYNMVEFKEFFKQKTIDKLLNKLK